MGTNAVCYAMFLNLLNTSKNKRMTRILFIQSGSADRALKALEVIRDKIFTKGIAVDYFADTVHPAPSSEKIPDLRRFIPVEAGVINALLMLLSLWRQNYDAAVVLFTKERGYLKHKLIALLARKSGLLIFNEHDQCFFFTFAKMYRHLRWRLLEYVASGRNRPLRYLGDSVRVIRNEGVVSFVMKIWNLLTVRPRRVRIRLKKRIGPLRFPSFEKPKVSIVIPVYNKILYTLNCLDSILEHTTDISYEVIVVDDKSTDSTPKRLAEVTNIKVIRADKNQGFVGSCNAGAAEARGEYIMFLNNDTKVTPGWLSKLAVTLDRDAFCGGVGSKLVYPDGRLQEAGGIIWEDASGWNYGKFDNPEKPEYNYVREVDYCSGAALMVRRSLLEKLGGLDERYAPAYWEDADLCFAIRRLGYRVLYQPASVVVHFEGISAGTSTASGMKKHQDLNTPTFIEKWRPELGRRFPNGKEVFLARDLNGSRRILVIDHYVPTHDKDAGSFVMYSLLRALAALGYRVVFWPENLFRTEPYTQELQQMGIEVIYGHRKFDDYMEKYGRYFDCALITRTHIAVHFVDTVRKYVPKVIYLAPDYEYVRARRRFELEGGSRDDLEKIRNRELYLFNESDLILTHNADEAEMIRAELPGKEVAVLHLPIRQITNMKTPFEDRQDLLFVGSSHPPNTDAILFYAREIMPLLHERLPGVRLYVVGGNPDRKLKEIESENIILTGYVEDLRPYFEKCLVYCAPLRYGAGVKGKIIEAMSFGLPIVTTSIGAEGLDAVNERHMLLAEGTVEIVEGVFKLCSNKSLWERVSADSRRFVAGNFSQDAFREKVRRLTISLLKVV